MECNKDEALRAKLVAEKKMASNDFEGARKIALKARNLFPELENISQILSVCDVHCSAQKTPVGSEKDWYGILQVDKLADDLTLKKQYRRLALFLHPDKNQFPGAEAAFKLICEANTFLSDPLKKSQYDAKLRMTVRYAPVNPHFNNRNSDFSYDLQSRNQHHAPQPATASIRMGMFWTLCPYCSLKYQYDKRFLYTKLLCQRCSKHFTPYEIGCPAGAPTMPPNPGGCQYAADSREKAKPYQCGPQDNLNARKQAPNRGTVSAVNLAQGGTKAFVDLKSKSGPKDAVNTSRGAKRTGKNHGNAVNKKQKDMKVTIRRKAKSFVVDSESSASGESSSSDSDVEMVDPATVQASGTSHVHYPRRSSRNRKTISYNEGDDDDDDHGDDDKDEYNDEGDDGIPTAPKQSQGVNHLSSDELGVQNDASKPEYIKSDVEDGFPSKPDGLKKESDEVKIVKPGQVDDAAANKLGRDPELMDSCLKNTDLGKNVIQAADPEFYDFEKDRDEERFADDQYWACYDDFDGMPRFYAKVKKVRRSPFKISFTWLEVDPVDESQRKWVACKFPVACGNFKLGKSDTSTARETFSHRVIFHNAKTKKRGSLMLLPIKGEIWALFRDWDWNWTSNPDHPSRGEYKYELVEVVDSVGDDIRVCYLCKVEGFVSVFKRSNCRSFLIGAKDLYRFSHEIPRYNMKGNEREGVLKKGYFELDPASLPSNPGDIFYPSESKTRQGTKQQFVDSQGKNTIDLDD